MKLITHLRTISGAVKYTLRHRPTQILIIENLRKNTKLEVPVTLCNIPIDLNGIPITQPMVKGSLVLVQDTDNHGVINLMFMCGKANKRTFYYVTQIIENVVPYLRTNTAVAYNGLYVGGLSLDTYIPKSLGVIHDIPIEKLNPNLYTTRLGELAESLPRLPAYMDRIEDDLISQMVSANYNTCLLFHKDGGVYLVDILKDIMYNVTERVYVDEKDWLPEGRPQYILLKQLKIAEETTKKRIIEEDEDDAWIKDFPPQEDDSEVEPSPAVELAAATTAVVISGLEPEQKSSIPIVKILIVLTALILLVFAGFTWMGK